MDEVLDERYKRKRDDDGPEESSLPAPTPSAGLPPPPPPFADSPRRLRERSRESERRYGDRPPRSSRDARDEFDDLPRYRRGGDRERGREKSIEVEGKSTTPAA